MRKESQKLKNKQDIQSQKIKSIDEKILDLQKMSIQMEEKITEIKKNKYSNRRKNHRSKK